MATICVSESVYYRKKETELRHTLEEGRLASVSLLNPHNAHSYATSRQIQAPRKGQNAISHTEVFHI
jgi:hypothetical protein